MKIIALGDIHGREIWEEIIAEHRFDKIVFIGDYFDSEEGISANRQKENFKNIISFKKANKNKVVLLFGNHDFHYLSTSKQTYAGYQQLQKTDFSELLNNAINEDLLQMCFVWSDLIFSHAGITKTWCRNNHVSIETIEESINDLLKYKPDSFKFIYGSKISSVGDDVFQSPIWVRPKSLMEDRIDGYIQVVGHTKQKKLMIGDDIILIDTLGTSGEYLVYEEGVFVSQRVW